MEEIIIVILQVALEVVLNSFACIPFDLGSYSNERADKNQTSLKCFLMFLVGTIIGLLSWVFIPKVMLPYSWLRILTLFLSPVLAGFVSLQIARFKAKREDVWPWRHFWYSFFACLGLVLVRFVFCAR